MTQLDDMDFIAVRIQRERRDSNSQLQCLAGLCNSPNQRLFGLQKAVGSIKRAERSYQQYFQLPLFSVLLASAFMGTNDERSLRNWSSRDCNRNRDKTGRISPVSTRSS